MTQPSTFEITEEQVEQDVPCGKCGKAAQLRSFGHGCSYTYATRSGRRAPYFKCVSCWQRWVTEQLATNAAAGRAYFLCSGCHQGFPTLDNFSKYEVF